MISAQSTQGITHISGQIGFAFGPVTLALETLGPFRLPEYAGSLFRGGFGKFFRELTVPRNALCTGCPGNDTVRLFPRVFESPGGSFAVYGAAEVSERAASVCLTPPPDQRGVVAAGTTMTLQIALIGPGLQYLPHFIRVFEAMGAGGSFGGRFRVSGVLSGTRQERRSTTGGRVGS